MAKTTDAETPAPIGNTFSRWMATHRDGMASAEAAEEMQKLVAAVVATGKPGTLTITVKVKPTSKGLSGAFVVEDKVKAKLPENERAQALYFADEFNNLTRDNPAQMTMELKAVPTAAPAPLKQVNG
jgi:hypothetical protein